MRPTDDSIQKVLEGFDATTGFLSAVSKTSGGEETTPLKTPSKSLAGVGTPLKRKATEPCEEVSGDAKKTSVAASPKEMPASSCKGASPEVMSPPSTAAASSKEMAPTSSLKKEKKEKKDKKEKKAVLPKAVKKKTKK